VRSDIKTNVQLVFVYGADLEKWLYTNTIRHNFVSFWSETDKWHRYHFFRCNIKLLVDKILTDIDDYYLMT